MSKEKDKGQIYTMFLCKKIIVNKRKKFLQWRQPKDVCKRDHNYNLLFENLKSYTRYWRATEIKVRKTKKWDSITQEGSRNRGSHFRNEE